jgi:hypothetical protein
MSTSLREEGNPADLVISKAKDSGYNLIVVGHKGQSALEHLIVGSTATNVVRYAHCFGSRLSPGSRFSEEEPMDLQKTPSCSTLPEHSTAFLCLRDTAWVPHESTAPSPSRARLARPR